MTRETAAIATAEVTCDWTNEITWTIACTITRLCERKRVRVHGVLASFPVEKCPYKNHQGRLICSRKDSSKNWFGIRNSYSYSTSYSKWDLKVASFFSCETYLLRPRPRNYDRAVIIQNGSCSRSNTQTTQGKQTSIQEFTYLVLCLPFSCFNLIQCGGLCPTVEHTVADFYQT